MGRPEILSELLRRANMSAPDMLVADVAAALGEAGCRHLILYVVDYEQETLCPVALAAELLGDDAPACVKVSGTMAGRAFQSQAVVTAETNGRATVWSPVRERAERLGVLEAGFDRLEDDTIQVCEDLGRLVGHLVRTADEYTDALELSRRRRPMSLAAEIQWDLLPPLTFSSPDVALAGILEPAYEVGGDAFDYGINGDILIFAMLDAMGHSVTSSLASALTLAGLRYGRLRGMDLVEIAHHIDQALIDQFHGETFVTGHLVRLDTTTGEMAWINAGHPDPLLLRGSAVVAEPHAEPCFPLGLGIMVSEMGKLRLEPGDKLLFYSDGVIEARPDGGAQYGIERLKERVERHLADHLIPAEIIRRIVKEVVVHRGAPLQDDASMVVIELAPHTIGG